MISYPGSSHVNLDLPVKYANSSGIAYPLSRQPIRFFKIDDTTNFNIHTYNTVYCILNIYVYNITYGFCLWFGYRISWWFGFYLYSHSVVEEAVAISWALCTKISQDARMCLSCVKQELGGASFPSDYTASDQSKATIFKVTHCLSCLFWGILRMEAHGGVSQSTRPTKKGPARAFGASPKYIHWTSGRGNIEMMINVWSPCQLQSSLPENFTVLKGTLKTKQGVTTDQALQVKHVVTTTMCNGPQWHTDAWLVLYTYYLHILYLYVPLYGCMYVQCM